MIPRHKENHGMNNPLMHRLLAIAALSATLFLGACERGVTEADEDHEEFYRVEVIDRGQAGLPVVATWVSGDGWVGTLPAVSLSSASQRITLGFRVFDEDGDELMLSEDEESVRYTLASGAPQGVLDMARPADVLFHGDHVYLYGAATGTTRIQFVLWHLDHADDATDPIDVTVVD
jgi:hypothetical protein